VDEIDAYFAGDVRFINVVRDGRDVVTSYHPEDPDSYLVSAEVWVWDVRNALEAQEKENAITVKYEDLIEATDETLKTICDFLEEPFLEDMTAYHRSTNVRQASAWDGPARPIHSSSLRKWERAEHEARVREFMNNSEAVALLHRLNYA
jgi:hypothetical protein